MSVISADFYTTEVFLTRAKPNMFKGL